VADQAMNIPKIRAMFQEMSRKTVPQGDKEAIRLVKNMPHDSQSPRTTFTFLILPSISTKNCQAEFDLEENKRAL